MTPPYRVVLHPYDFDRFEMIMIKCIMALIMTSIESDDSACAQAVHVSVHVNANDQNLVPPRPA